MPGNRNRPPELAAFDRPEVVKGTERYLPQSLLGYDFLNKGIMTEALVEGTNLQITGLFKVIPLIGAAQILNFLYILTK